MDADNGSMIVDAVDEDALSVASEDSEAEDLVMEPFVCDWARAIKQAAQDCPDIDDKKISDFEFVQYALILREDVEEATTRIAHMQGFREEYNIKDTLEDGLQSILDMMEQQPGTLVAMEERPQEEGSQFILYWALGADYLNPKTVLKHPRPVFASGYYLCTAAHCHFAAILEGMIFKIDAAGLGWKHKSAQFTMRRKLMSELCSVYPMMFRGLGYNTPTIANILASLIKSLLPRSTAFTVDVGCRWDEDEHMILDGNNHNAMPIAHINDRFPPGPERDKKLLLQLKTRLEIRYRNEREFRL